MWKDKHGPWTEKEVQLALFGWLEKRGRTLILPNFTPSRWHECDMFSVTKTLYFHEIEVKVSRSDFRADLKKTEKHRILSGRPVSAEEEVWYGAASRWHVMPDFAPRTFMYACPAGMLSTIDVPEYAGLITVQRIAQGGWKGYEVNVLKKAPVISGSKKMSTDQAFQIVNNIWYRYAGEWKKRVRLEL